jgi:hypothetical protein
MSNGVLTMIGFGPTWEDCFDFTPTFNGPLRKAKLASSLKRGSSGLVAETFACYTYCMIIKAPQVSSYQVFEINQPDK